jgi:hypothetical protein
MGEEAEMKSLTNCSGLIALCAFVLATPVAGQDHGVSTVTAESTEREDTVSVADRLSPSAYAGRLLAVRPLESRQSVASTPAWRQARSRGTALAVVGGALFVGGLVAGGDAGTAMVVVGAGIGAYGLYRMLAPDRG